MANTTQQLREELIQELQKDPTSVASVVEKLRQHTDEGLCVDPRNEPQCFETWLQVFGLLLQNKLPNPAAEIVIAWYDRLNELQVLHGRRYHKGGAAHNAGVCFFSQGENTRGVWFYACAYVEDVFNSADSAVPQTLASQHLRVHFNWIQSDFEALATTARNLKAAGDSLWYYPEATLVSLAREQKLKIPLPRGATDIPVNRPFLKQLIDKLPAGNDHQKKEALEFLASYLAVTLPGVRINANVKAHANDATFEHEMDLVVTQYGSTPTYLLEALGRHFLVECKNWDSKVGVQALNHFVAKMRFHRCKCGVIFSREGLSGDKDMQTGLRFARVTQLRWYQQDDCVVIVITKQHLDELAANGGSFSETLLRGYESVRFSGAS
jgi:hypothetical protein